MNPHGKALGYKAGLVRNDVELLKWVDTVRKKYRKRYDSLVPDSFRSDQKFELGSRHTKFPKLLRDNPDKG